MLFLKGKASSFNRDKEAFSNIVISNTNGIVLTDWHLSEAFDFGSTEKDFFGHFFFYETHGKRRRKAPILLELLRLVTFHRLSDTVGHTKWPQSCQYLFQVVMRYHVGSAVIDLLSIYTFLCMTQGLLPRNFFCSTFPTVETLMHICQLLLSVDGNLLSVNILSLCNEKVVKYLYWLACHVSHVQFLKWSIVCTVQYVFLPRLCSFPRLLSPRLSVSSRKSPWVINRLLCHGWLHFFTISMAFMTDMWHREGRHCDCPRDTMGHALSHCRSWVETVFEAFFCLLTLMKHPCQKMFASKGVSSLGKVAKLVASSANNSFVSFDISQNYTQPAFPTRQCMYVYS